MIVVIMGGLIQIAMGALRIGRFVAYTPAVVVSGFMSGIGIIIMLIQSLPFLGLPPAAGGPMGAMRALPDALANASPRRGRRRDPDAGRRRVCGRSGWGSWCRLPWWRWSWGTSVAILWLPGIPVIGEIPTGLPSLQFALPSAGFLLGAVPAGAHPRHPRIGGQPPDFAGGRLGDGGRATRRTRELVGQGHRQHRLRG